MPDVEETVTTEKDRTILNSGQNPRKPDNQPNQIRRSINRSDCTNALELQEIIPCKNSEEKLISESDQWSTVDGKIMLYVMLPMERKLTETIIRWCQQKPTQW